jgi:hypothetical protein
MCPSSAEVGTDGVVRGVFKALAPTDCGALPSASAGDGHRPGGGPCRQHAGAVADVGFRPRRVLVDSPGGPDTEPAVRRVRPPQTGWSSCTRRDISGRPHHLPASSRHTEVENPLPGREAFHARATWGTLSLGDNVRLRARAQGRRPRPGRARLIGGTLPDGAPRHALTLKNWRPLLGDQRFVSRAAAEAGAAHPVRDRARLPARSMAPGGHRHNGEGRHVLRQAAQPG